MTREHLVQDIENVLELVNRAADSADPERAREAQRALVGLSHHIQNETGVPPTVEGCLQEAAASAGPEADAPTADAWRSARACLETALDFARGE